MKKIRLLLLICLIVASIPTNISKAYTIGPQKSYRLLDISFFENKKVVKTGDNLHISLKLNTVDKLESVKIAFYAYGPDFLVITYTLKYNEFTGCVECTNEMHVIGLGGIKIFNKFNNELPEMTYNLSSIYAITEEGERCDISDPSNLIKNNISNFTFNNNCANGIHTGGSQTTTHGKICKICGTEYEPKIMVSFTDPPTQLEKNQSYNFKYAKSKKDDKILSWKSTNDKVVSVNSKGKIIGKNKGSAYYSHDEVWS